MGGWGGGVVVGNGERDLFFFFFSLSLFLHSHTLSLSLCRLDHRRATWRESSEGHDGDRRDPAEQSVRPATVGTIYQHAAQAPTKPVGFTLR